MAVRAVGAIPSFNPLLTRIVESLERNGEPERHDLAELSAAGLLTQFAQKIQYIARKPPARTADLRTFWKNDIPVEVEVTRADEKIEHTNRRLQSGSLAEELLAVGSCYDLTIHIGDILADDERRKLLLAAKIAEPNKPIDCTGIWNIYAEEIPDRPGDCLDIKPEEFIAPAWWPTRVAEPYTVRANVGPACSSEPLPRVRLRWPLSEKAYINPIQNKAAHFQGSENAVYIVAIDVTYLPGAFKWYEKHLGGYFEIWNFISGILAFETGVSSRVFWQWQFYRNPHAINPIPPDVAACFRMGKWTLGFDLWTK